MVTEVLKGHRPVNKIEGDIVYSANDVDSEGYALLPTNSTVYHIAKFPKLAALLNTNLSSGVFLRNTAYAHQPDRIYNTAVTNTLLGVNEDGSVYKSTNAGRSWTFSTQRTRPASAKAQIVYAFCPGVTALGGFVAVSVDAPNTSKNIRVDFSRDGGRTWSSGMNRAVTYGTNITDIAGIVCADSAFVWRACGGTYHADRVWPTEDNPIPLAPEHKYEAWEISNRIGANEYSPTYTYGEIANILSTYGMIITPIAVPGSNTFAYVRTLKRAENKPEQDLTLHWGNNNLYGMPALVDYLGYSASHIGRSSDTIWWSYGKQGTTTRERLVFLEGKTILFGINLDGVIEEAINHPDTKIDLLDAWRSNNSEYWALVKHVPLDQTILLRINSAEVVDFFFLDDGLVGISGGKFLPISMNTPIIIDDMGVAYGTDGSTGISHFSSPYISSGDDFDDVRKILADPQ